MRKTELIGMARDSLNHARAGTITQADDVLRVPASIYYAPERWQRELDRVFRRLPLMVSTSAELPAAGDYKAMNAAGVPVLLIRGAQGNVKAYINSCAHRGAQIMDEGRGHARRFTCPYHAWSYNTAGELTHIYCASDFGAIDKSRYGLVPLPCLERSGLVWVITNPSSNLDIPTFLSGYDSALAHFDFADWHYFGSRCIEGPDWKIAYDGYLDFYHLPILHKETFGADTSNKALYYSWGPHQHVKSPQTTEMHLGALDETDWPTALLLSGVWTVFPHVSIASFGEDGERRGVLISQLFPGDTPGTSYTVQHYLLQRAPDKAGQTAAAEQFKLLGYIVEAEDYATGLKQQACLQSGAREHILFGRNEAGGQNFHRWLQTILDTEDAHLNDLFASADPP
ncbi:MAG: aromatic ring-hydroxylating dioxygenase subunit alpha [Halioglobus sp.]|nr:aromatic ring-hydroxylating dioxygenase subunit alpha [Halioglobus sp.]